MRCGHAAIVIAIVLAAPAARAEPSVTATSPETTVVDPAPVALVPLSRDRLGVAVESVETHVAVAIDPASQLITRLEWSDDDPAMTTWRAAIGGTRALGRVRLAADVAYDHTASWWGIGNAVEAAARVETAISIGGHPFALGVSLGGGHALDRTPAFGPRTSGTAMLYLRTTF